MSVSISQAAAAVAVFDFAEIFIEFQDISVDNPFLDVQVSGLLFGGGVERKVDGFCDSVDGTRYKIRFLAMTTGRHDYRIDVVGRGVQESASGSFTAVDSDREGLLQIDEQHPFHFVRSGTGSNFFWNGTTAYFLFGWDLENAKRILDRLSEKGINQVRSALCARTENGSNWSEDNVVETDDFRFRLCPWVAQNPESVEDPGVDTTRYDVSYWQHMEAILEYARSLGITVSVIFYVDGQHPRVDPFGKEGMGSTEEIAYYRYAAARLAAFENVTWCVTNEYHLFRNDDWVETMGSLLQSFDPYGHISTVHAFGEFHFMASTWSGYASYQVWDQPGGNVFMLGQRSLQRQSGRILPQVNEEYGYEDHYPAWGHEYTRPMRDARSRRKIAWSISMAGCYQTTGERADAGTGAGDDSGGGWINGRGDGSMVMLDGYKTMVGFFSSVPWYTLEPRNDLVQAPALCLAGSGLYIVYLSEGANTKISLPKGQYSMEMFNPETGERQLSGPLELSGEVSLACLENSDLVWLISSTLSDLFLR